MPGRSLRSSRHLVPVGVLVLTLLLTSVVVFLFAANARARDRARFENGVQSMSERIQRRLDAYVALLRATDGLFSSQRRITAGEFSKYVSLLELPTEYRGIQGIGFTRRFDRAERAAVERWARSAGGHPDFHAWPEVPGNELHAIVFLEPLDARNRAAIGFNMYSEPVRREAMARARDTGQPAMSGKVTLKQEIDQKKQAGFLIYVPVYRGGQVPDTVEGRREALVGFVYSPFRADDLLNGVFGAEQHPDLAFDLYDGTAVGRDRLLHSSHGADEREETPRFTATSTITVAGRPWTMSFSTLPAFDDAAAGRLVVPLGLAGLLVAIALFVMTRAQARAHAEAERSADVLRDALEQRARAEEWLREADRRKDDFLAMLAHELRNPLAPMLTAIQLMERKLRAGETVGRERDVVERQLHHLRRLVDDLLDVSRVTRGKVQLQKRRLDLVSAAERAVEFVRPVAEARHHVLHAELPQDPLWIEADPVRIEQVASNLLHNAVKYTEPGGRITLTLEREGDEGVLRVADTGVGISAEALPHLFEPFVQVEQTLDRSQGGLGLGLTLVRRLVELHGGSVSASSEGVGKGSVFAVRLPLMAGAGATVEAAAVRATEEQVPAGPRRVLVVDDNRDAAELLVEVLEMDGHVLEMAHDGPSAVHRFESFGPDVVLLDIGLPGMDGYEVARRIRQGRGGDSVMLVAITGYGQASDRQRSADAGFDAHFVKPVEIDALRAVVDGAGLQSVGSSEGRPPLAH